MVWKKLFTRWWWRVAAEVSSSKSYIVMYFVREDFRFVNKLCIHFSSLRHSTCPTHLPWFDYCFNVTRSLTKLRLCRIVSDPNTNIDLGILLARACSLSSSTVLAGKLWRLHKHQQMLQFWFLFFVYRCTVHFGICRVHSPTNALFNLKNTLKFTLKYT